MRQSAKKITEFIAGIKRRETIVFGKKCRLGALQPTPCLTVPILGIILRYLEILGVEVDECVEQDMGRVRSQLFRLPQMLLLDMETCLLTVFSIRIRKIFAL